MRGPGVKLVRRTVRNAGRKPVTYWQLRWPGREGRNRTENIGRTDEMTAAQAADRRRLKIVELATGAAVRDPSRITVSEYLALDREAIDGDVASGTIRTHERDSKRLIAAVGDMRLDRLAWTEVAKLKSWLLSERTIDGKTRRACGRATVNATMSTLKAAWNRARKRGLVASNPFADAGLGKVQPKQKRIYSPQEAEAMIEVSPDAWWKAFIAAGFTTGLRLGELLSLTWEDIAGDEVAVTAKRAGVDRLAWSAKSHHERRVPMPAETRTRLEPLRLLGGGSPYVFIGRDRLAKLLAKQGAGNLPEPSNWINNLLRDFKAIQAAAKIKRGGTIHDLRRSFGTVMAGHVAMHELRAIMGHASITTTADFYLGATEDVKAKVNRAFSRTA